jgi:hypothetical protein
VQALSPRLLFLHAILCGAGKLAREISNQIQIKRTSLRQAKAYACNVYDRKFCSFQSASQAPGAPRLAPFETWDLYLYFVIPSVVEGPCVCSALNKQAQVSNKSRKFGWPTPPKPAIRSNTKEAAPHTKSTNDED